jgi:hypothetical protein
LVVLSKLTVEHLGLAYLTVIIGVHQLEHEIDLSLIDGVSAAVNGSDQFCFCQGIIMIEVIPSVELIHLFSEGQRDDRGGSVRSAVVVLDWFCCVVSWFRGIVVFNWLSRVVVFGWLS